MRKLIHLILVLSIIGVTLGQASSAYAACTSPYVVQRGDTLSRIARNCGTTVSAIQTTNGLKGTTIYIGQQLIIPGAGGGATGGAVSAGGSHTVQRGDTLYKIAIKFGVTIDAIKAANGLKSNTIRIGQVLVIPGGSGGAAVSNPPPSTQAAPPPQTGTTDRTGGEKLVIANYFPWYDEGFWGQGVTWDTPTVQYNSDHISTIQRHIGWAQQAGLDGFAVHWFQQGNRTDTNLANVLGNSPGGFRSTVTFLTHILPGANRGMVIDNLRYLINTYGQHGSFLRVNGKPVIFFADMDRVPLEGASSAVNAWQSIRNEVDPGNSTIWIAEGLKPAYLGVFDGLYVYKIDHACCPASYNKAPTWAGWVRQWEKQTGKPKLWVGTLMPGWDDSRSVGRPDLRTPSPAFARDRQGGAYYQATFNAVVGTSPDMLIIHSFNEWIEGSQIEPGTTYGDTYLNLTKQFSNQFKGK
ncbi:MAG TPA: LysM peptidoglycan-binding domain-containing protein [Anaerolineales bacterium]|nr:LysM peptidoglycan-binding domain-containing protein [Anaerolineales bacterium]